jgi:hypothetical protein
MRVRVVFLLIGITLVVLAPPATAAASIAVSPSANLVNGQAVAVQGGGFAASDKVVLHECIRVGTSPLACDYRKPSASDRYGRLNGTTMKLYNSVKGNSCTTANPCFVRAKDTHGNVAKATVTFGPH